MDRTPFTYAPAATLVAVHGNGGGAFRFSLVAPHMPDSVDLVTPTLPGFDGTPLPAGPLDVAAFSEALGAAITGLPRPLVLLGHGIGGAIALDLLSRDPDAADGLVLHAPVGTRLDTRLFPRVMRRRPVQELARRAIASPLAAPLWRSTIVRSMRADVADEFLRGYAECRAFGVMFDLLDVDWFEGLAKVDLPSVLLWGAEDRVLGADQRADYHELLRDASELVVPGWGHFPMLVDPAGYARRIAAVALGVAARGGHPVPLVPVGSGQLERLGVAGKAARLELQGDLVPDAAVVPHGQDPRIAAGAAVEWFDDGSRPAVLAVRSAFAAEDGEEASRAGWFTSLLDVPADVDALAAAIERVRGSAAERLGEAASEARTDVLLMRMVAARRAGVAFSETGYLDDLVEHVDGLADGLLAGAEAGTRERLPRAGTGEPLEGWRGRLQQVLADVRRHAGRDDLDVEWVDDGHRCQVVQVRPITAAPLRDEALTAANHREILPDPPSRFMTSLIADAGLDIFTYWQSFDEEVPRGRPLTEELALRPWINLDLLTDTMRVLGLPTSLVTDTMGGAAHVDVPLKPRRILRKLPALTRMGLDQLRAVDRSATHMAELRELGFAAASTQGIRDTVALARTTYVRLLTGMFPLSTAVSIPLAVLSRVGLAGELQLGGASAGTAVMRDLFAVREAARDEADLRALAAGRPVTPGLQRAWDSYLNAHGHRGIFESDLARPRFAEDPSPLLALLLGGRIPDPAEAEPARRRLLRTAAGPVWWQASRAIRAREEYRSAAMRAFQHLRGRLVTLAEEAAAAGQLPDAESLWDLTVAEAAQLDDGHVFDEVFLQVRRKELAQAARLHLPDLVRRLDDLEVYDPEQQASPEAADVLRGRGLTSGVVTGTAVCMDQPGEIPRELAGRPLVLVARAIDVGWIATFGMVDAVVVETGGDLSHGSIILRELGITAATNVAGAVRALRTGDLVTVDGRAGTVRRTAPA